MPLQLTAPIYKTFTLDKTDEKYNCDEATTITIKQATQREHEKRMDLFAVLEAKYSNLNREEVSYVQRLSSAELMRLEVWLTLCECNILDLDGKPLFPSKKVKDEPRLSLSQTQFVEAWGKLDPFVADEIHSKVLEVNILWRGPEGEALSQGV